MQHYKRRCKHCGKIYTYCTHGNKDGCSMDYCGCCQTAINDALAKIPVRYVKRFAYVENPDEIAHLERTFGFLKERLEESKKDTISAYLTKVVPSNGYKDIEHCIISWVEYHKYVDHNGDIIYKVAMEYDTVDGKFTGNKYENMEGSKDQYIPVSISRMYDGVDCSVPVKPLSSPKGDIFYMSIK